MDYLWDQSPQFHSLQQSLIKIRKNRPCGIAFATCNNYCYVLCSCYWLICTVQLSTFLTSLEVQTDLGMCWFLTTQKIYYDWSVSDKMSSPFAWWPHVIHVRVKRWVANAIPEGLYYRIFNYAVINTLLEQ